MYFRYFMWNFAGRQDDIQGTYANTNGRWISGIPFIDNSHKFFTPDWPQEHLPQSALQNKGRNKFYMIPLIIGLIGFIFTFFRDEKTFWFLAIFFFTTGLAQIIFQNEPPVEPRERDYATACSYAVFTLWMGFGVIALFDTFIKRLKMRFWSVVRMRRLSIMESLLFLLTALPFRLFSSLEQISASLPCAVHVTI